MKHEIQKNKNIEKPSELDIARRLKSIEQATRIQEGMDEERALKGIEEATTEEEKERKRRGLTLEPEAKVIEKEQPKEQPVENKKKSGLGGTMFELGERQRFLKEYDKWTKDYLYSSAISMDDLPFYPLEPDTEIENLNSFEISPFFIDYLLANAATEIGKDRMIGFLRRATKISFLNIVNSDNITLRLEMRKNIKLYSHFKKKYPFEFLAIK